MDGRGLALQGGPRSSPIALLLVQACDLADSSFAQRLAGVRSFALSAYPGTSCGKLESFADSHSGALRAATLETLQAQVISLSKDDRARLLERLLASLDVDTEVEEEWEALAAQRQAELESGTVVGVPLEDAIAHLRARFPG